MRSRFQHHPNFEKYKIASSVYERLMSISHMTDMSGCLEAFEKGLLEVLKRFRHVDSYLRNDESMILHALDSISDEIRKFQGELQTNDLNQQSLTEAQKKIHWLKSQFICEFARDKYRFSKKSLNDLLEVSQQLQTAVTFDNESARAYLGYFWLEYTVDNSLEPITVLQNLGVENPLELIIRSGSNRNITAITILATLYAEGKYVQQKKERALFYINECLALDDGISAEKLLNIGSTHFTFSADEWETLLCAIAERDGQKTALLLAEIYGGRGMCDLLSYIQPNVDKAIHYYMLVTRSEGNLEGHVALQRICEFVADDVALRSLLDAEIENENPTVLYWLGIIHVPEEMRLQDIQDMNYVREPFLLRLATSIYPQRSLDVAIRFFEKLNNIDLDLHSGEAGSLLKDLQHQEVHMDRLSRRWREKINVAVNLLTRGESLSMSYLAPVENKITIADFFSDPLQLGFSLYNIHTESCRMLSRLWHSIISDIPPMHEPGTLTAPPVFFVRTPMRRSDFFVKYSIKTTKEVHGVIQALELCSRRALGGFDETIQLQEIERIMQGLIEARSLNAPLHIVEDVASADNHSSEIQVQTSKTRSWCSVM